MTRGACANGFSSVGGGFNGGSIKLEGDVISWFRSRRSHDEDIAACRLALRRFTKVVAKTDRGLAAETLRQLWLTQQLLHVVAQKERWNYSATICRHSSYWLSALVLML
jgi:hypothetical protein